MRFQFLRENAKWLLAPFLLCVASGFGQTFFISIFGGHIREEFGLNYGQWGGIYMAGTLASAAAMMLLGELADKMAIKKLASGILLLFAVFCLLMSWNQFYWALPVIIFGLRFCGQGMLPHISQVVTARWFSKNRAKAIAATSIGVGVAEALLPPSFVQIMNATNWRIAWMIAAGFVLLFFFVIRPLLAEKRIPQNVQQGLTQPGMFERDWTRREMLKNWVFWISVPALIALPFLATTFMFQLPVLASSKEWGLAMTTLRLPVWVFAAFFGLILGGILIDRWSVRQVMPWIYIPVIFGFAVIAHTHSIAFLPLGLALGGFTQGLNAAIGGVFAAEYYGTKHLGSIRAVISAAMVFSTAVGPWLSGRLLDQGMSYDEILWLMAGYALLASLLMVIISLGTKNAWAN